MATEPGQQGMAAYLPKTFSRRKLRDAIGIEQPSAKPRAAPKTYYYGPGISGHIISKIKNNSPFVLIYPE